MEDRAVAKVAQEVFEAWAPADSKWSAWAKPVLFMDTRISHQSVETGELPPMDTLSYVKDSAIVVDLLGRASALMGLALAKVGYQPVPVWNSGGANGELVGMRVIAMELGACAATLRGLKRKEGAMPAFLMNADRLDNSNLKNAPNRYDNRWALVPQDLPSADFLKANGVKHVVLVAERVRDDLAHVLLRWQEAGIDIRRTPDGVTQPLKIEVARPSRFRELGYHLAVLAGLRRNSAGGFGAVIPDPSASGGGVGYG